MSQQVHEFNPALAIPMTVPDALVEMHRVEGRQLVGMQCVLGHFEIFQPEGGIPADATGGIRTIQHLSHNDAMTQVRTEFQMTGIVPAPAPDVPAIAVRVTEAQVVRFIFEGTPDQRAREAFAKINSIMVQWPYWREFLNSSLTRLGVAASPLPLMDLTKAADMAGYGPESSHPSKAAP